jgi:cytoskeleton protein RodZ
MGGAFASTGMPLNPQDPDHYAAPSWNDEAAQAPLADAHTLADGLRAARVASGRSLEELAEATRIRRQYLDAIENGQYERLPSRPFSTGYIRAYARALGLDEEVAAERFRVEHPDASTPLRAPIGSDVDDLKPRSTAWFVGAGVIIVAVVLWNVARHAMIKPKQEAAGVPAAAAAWKVDEAKGPIRLSAPLPAPKDQTVPDAYITPGMQDPTLNANATGQPDPAAAAVAVAGPLDSVPVGAAFNPRGAVYGAAPDASHVTLQARKAAAVVLRGSDGVVYFARQLAAGEAYRAPASSGLVIDVSDPLAFDVFYNGEYHGGLAAQVTPLTQMNGQAAQLAAASARQHAAPPAAAPPPAG